jgi:UPF0755 protein
VTIPQELKVFTVNRGEPVDQALQKLHAEHLLPPPLVLRLYLKLTRQQPNIGAGTYSFPDRASPLEILALLQQGTNFERFTVVEGWNRFDIAEAMARVNVLKLSDRKDAMRLFNNTNLIQDLDPAAKNLEGYLYPDTYFLDPDTTGQELVSEMVSRFKKVWQQRLQNDAMRRRMRVHDAVVVASLIETEAKLPEERPVIASVIYNRLRASMPLSIDSTLVYASKLAGTWRNDGHVYLSDVNRVSPYNTRKISGLPPGAVGSPGLASLEAALNPAHTNYLFYVRNPCRNDGAHNFYSDEKGFEVGVAALRAWEKQQKHILPALRRSS